MQAAKTYKSPSQLKGECYLRSKNALVPTSVLRNTERVKLKARALRLKEEFKHKYLTRRKSAIIRQVSQNISVAPAVPESSIIVPDYIESIPSRLRRTLTFCIALWFSLLTVIVICIVLGYSSKYILPKNDELRHYY
jgi:hypothetical protein